MSDDEGLYIECACDATTTTLASPNRIDVSLIISYTPQNMQISFAAIEIGIWTYEKMMNENKMAEMLVRAHLVITREIGSYDLRWSSKMCKHSDN